MSADHGQPVTREEILCKHLGDPPEGKRYSDMLHTAMSEWGNRATDEMGKLLMTRDGQILALETEVERLKGLIDDLLTTGYSGLARHEQGEFIKNYKSANNI